MSTQVAAGGRTNIDPEATITVASVSKTSITVYTCAS